MRDLEKNVTKKRIGTQAVHAGVRPDVASGAIMTPIIQATTYVQLPELGQNKLSTTTLVRSILHERRSKRVSVR